MQVSDAFLIVVPRCWEIFKGLLGKVDLDRSLLWNSDVDYFEELFMVNEVQNMA